MVNDVIKWSAVGGDGPLFTEDQLAAECCCCTPCGTVGGALCVCQYLVTFAGLTGDSAAYNGEHLMTGNGCVWYAEGVAWPTALELWWRTPPLNDGDYTVVLLSLNDAAYVSYWGKLLGPPYPDYSICGIGGTYAFLLGDTPNQSAATCTVEEL